MQKYAKPIIMNRCYYIWIASSFLLFPGVYALFATFEIPAKILPGECHIIESLAIFSFAIQYTSVLFGL